MSYSLSLDGGGSKLAAVLFDEEGALVAHAAAGSVNPRFAGHRQVIGHIEDCFRRLFAGRAVPRLERILCASVAEDRALYLNALSAYSECGEWIDLGEGRLGLLACGIYPSGVLALSGTGSDVFYIKDGRQEDIIGGHGALISDAGSGYAIGKAALEAALRAAEGWGPPTVLLEEICRQLDIGDIHEAVTRIYRSPAPVGAIASLTRSVGLAAERRDATALEILEDAGTILAEQVQSMLRRHPEAASLPLAVIGGAFKTHPLLLDAFRRRLAPLPVRTPLFEPVVGGVVYEIYRRYGALSQERLRALEEDYAAFRMIL